MLAKPTEKCVLKCSLCYKDEKKSGRLRERRVILGLEKSLNPVESFITLEEAAECESFAPKIVLGFTADANELLACLHRHVCCCACSNTREPKTSKQ